MNYILILNIKLAHCFCSVLYHTFSVLRLFNSLIFWPSLELMQQPKTFFFYQNVNEKIYMIDPKQKYPKKVYENNFIKYKK